LQIYATDTTDKIESRVAASECEVAIFCFFVNQLPCIEAKKLPEENRKAKVLNTVYSDIPLDNINI
jgi:hypothetical protein